MRLTRAMKVDSVVVAAERGCGGGTGRRGIDWVDENSNGAKQPSTGGKQDMIDKVTVQLAAAFWWQT